MPKQVAGASKITFRGWGKRYSAETLKGENGGWRNHLAKYLGRSACAKNGSRASRTGEKRYLSEGFSDETTRIGRGCHKGG